MVFSFDLELDEDICDHLKCPITDMIFLEPVVAEDGFIYEHEAILKWIRMYSDSPLTKKHLSSDRLINCIPYKKQVDGFLEKHPDYRQLQYIPAGDDELILDYIINGQYSKLLRYNSFKADQLKDHFENIFHRVEYGVIDKHTIGHILDNIDDINVKNSRQSLIHYVCSYCPSDVTLKFLRKPDLNLEETTSLGWRPIHSACMYGTYDTIKYLVDRGVRLEAKTSEGNRPIHLVCQKQNLKKELDSIKLLVDAGVNLNVKNNSDWRPIDFIFLQGTEEVIEYFLTTGAKLDLDHKVAFRWNSYNLNDLLSVNPNPGVSRFKIIPKPIQKKSKKKPVQRNSETKPTVSKSDLRQIRKDQKFIQQKQMKRINRMNNRARAR